MVMIKKNQTFLLNLPKKWTLIVVFDKPMVLLHFVTLRVNGRGINSKVKKNDGQLFSNWMMRLKEQRVL